MLFVNRKGRFISLCSLVDSGENQKRDTYFEFKKSLCAKWMVDVKQMAERDVAEM